MTTLEDRVRAATYAAAEIITPDSVPPLRITGPADSPRITLDKRRRWPGWQSWAAPLAAAAAVVAIVVGMSALQGGRSPGTAPSRNGLTAGPPVTAYTSAGTVPAYYVALVSNGNPNFVPSYAVVRSTATGRVLATVRPPAHGTFVAVTGAANDRTFVLGEQHWATGNADQTFEPETFYLLSLGSAGNVRVMKRLPGVPVQPQGSMVTGLALSPDGRKLAEAVQPAHLTREAIEIQIYSVPGGAVRTWSGDGTIGTSEDDSAALSWTADGRTLAFDWSDSREVSVRLLDTSAAGGSLIADSRAAVLIRKLTPVPPPSASPARTATRHGAQPLSCQTDEIISPDGSVIVCGASAVLSTSASHSFRIKITAQQGFIDYSVATGKVARIVGEQQVQELGGIGIYWSGAAGKILIVAIPSGSGTRVGVISGEEFTPLPGTANLGGAAW